VIHVIGNTDLSNYIHSKFESGSVEGMRIYDHCGQKSYLTSVSLNTCPSSTKISETDSRSKTNHQILNCTQVDAYNATNTSMYC
jgi:hypothetical protein